SAQNAYDISILELKQLMELDPSTEIVLEQPPLPEFENITTAYSAEEVYLEAKSIYPEIKQASYNTLAAEKNIDIVKGGYYPTLSLSGGLGSGYSSADKDYTTGVERPFHQQIDDNFSTFVGLSLSIPIFNNFQTRIAVKKAKISYENALLGERQAENNLSKVIHQAVVDLRAAEKSYYSNEQAFEASKQAFEVIKQRYEVGLANSIELNTSQTNMNKAEFDLIQAKYNLIFRSKVIDFYLGKPITFNENLYEISTMAKKKSKLKYVIIGLVVLLVLVIIANKMGGIGQGKTIKVATEKAEKRTVNETVSASGKIQPEIEVKLSSEVSGEIVELKVKEGDIVKQGQVLCRVKPDILQSGYDRAIASLNSQKATLAAAQEQLKQTEASFENIEANFKRNEELFNKKVISVAEFETA